MTSIVVSGPSGVGKNTVVTKVLEALPELTLAGSLTTRPPRPNDVPGKYAYVSRPEFEARIAKGEMLEWAEYNGNLYGTPRPATTDKLLFEIEVQGAAQVKKLFPEAFLIFMVPPGKNLQEQMKVLNDRLQIRATDTAATIQQRLVTAEGELKRGQRQSDAIIVNDDLPTAVRDMIARVKQYLAEQKKVREDQEIRKMNIPRQ